MKAGDLVSLKMKTTPPPRVPRHAIVLNTWHDHKGEVLEIEVMWTEEEFPLGRYWPGHFEVAS